MIFMISAVDSNNSSIDRIFQIGYGPNGKISLSAGSDGWVCFGNGGEVYDTTVSSQPSLQVWERTDSTNYSASKFYLNGSEQVVASISNGTGLPDDTSTYTQIGHDSFHGKMGEFIVLNSTDLEDRQKLEGYLAHKWGLSHNLPTAHPYKYNSPDYIKWSDLCGLRTQMVDLLIVILPLGS